eukprot:scaffold13328_cov112-Isochrysis_galbana.AAC.1
MPAAVHDESSPGSDASASAARARLEGRAAASSAERSDATKASASASASATSVLAPAASCHFRVLGAGLPGTSSGASSPKLPHMAGRRGVGEMQRDTEKVQGERGAMRSIDLQVMRTINSRTRTVCDRTIKILR